jgi:hypothetical protein
MKKQNQSDGTEPTLPSLCEQVKDVEERLNRVLIASETTGI